MSPVAPNILLLCNPGELEEIEGILEQGGFTRLVWEDEGDQALARYDQELPDVVVVCAGLARGDTKDLITAMRDRPHGQRVRLILVGQDQGPVRNALDARDFAIDRFVSRPLAANALLFAVRTCAEAAAGEGEAAAAGEGETAVAGEGETAAAGEGEAAAAGPDSQLERKMESAMNEAIDDFVRAAIEALPSVGKGRRSPVLRSTLVSTPPPPVAGSGAAAPPRALAGARPTTSEDSDRPGGGAFARDLRRKMSVMAERLFPGQRVEQSVQLGLAHNHSTEIDLSSFGMDTVSGAEDDPIVDRSARPASHRRPGPVGPGPEGPGPEASAPPSSAAASAVASAVADTPPGPVASERMEPERPERIDPEPPANRQPGLSADAAPVTALSGDVSGDALAAEGAIRRGEADVAILIERMYRRRFTGRVSFQLKDAEKEILFDKGRPVFASSNVAHDRMGDQLLREGKITQRQFDSVRSVVSQSGRRMGEVLIEMGWLKRRELLPVVRRHIEDIVYSLFAWDSGRYAISEGEYAAAERIRISRHPVAMILEGVRRKFDGEALEALLGSPESVIEIIDERKLKTVVSVADLSSPERKVIASFDGERSLLDIHRGTSMDLVEVYQLGYGLVVWGAAQSLRRGDQSQSLVPEEPVVVGETDLAIDRQRVMAKYALVIEADYFSLLGVRRDATSFEIKRAYEAARRDYAGEGFPPEVRGELSTEIGDINEVLEEAYRVLRDDGLRTSYLSNLCD
jgi:CheY-like chemotaxis protein